jgi:hypothetical protein
MTNLLNVMGQYFNTSTETMIENLMSAMAEFEI